MDGHNDVPGLADVNVRELRNAVDDFAVKMTGAEFKNSIAGISSLPAVELVGYVARLNSRMDQQLYEGWRVPCLGLTIIGKLDISAFM